MTSSRINYDDMEQDALLSQMGGGNRGGTAPISEPPQRRDGPRIVYRDGKTYLAEHGNERWLQGREVSDAQGYVNDYWSANGGNPDGDPIRDAYRQYLGREADDAGYAAHSRNPGGQSAAIDFIKNSDEAKAYAASLAAGGGQPGSSGGTGGAAGLGGGSTPFEGFDFQRAQDTGFSAKDSFAKAASAAGEPPPGLDKAALAGWFDKYIRPGMEADGHKINWVEGDKMNFTSPQGTFTVDWVRGAGADGYAFAWQVEDGSGGAPAGGGAAPVAQADTSNQSLANAEGLASSDLFERLMAEAQAAATGKGSPMNMDALLQLLKG
jgi:hypothetical protein